MVNDPDPEDVQMQGWGSLTKQDALRMPPYFAEGAADPLVAKIWGSEFGDPHGMNDGEMLNVFDDHSHDELAGVAVFAGPVAHARKFVLDAQAWLDGSWRDLGSAQGGVDCVALCVWDDGRGWAVAGCGHVGEFGVADSVAESIENEGEQPPEVAEAMLLMAGERELAKMAAAGSSGKKSSWPVAEAIAMRIMAKREAIAIGAATGASKERGRPKAL